MQRLIFMSLVTNEPVVKDGWDEFGLFGFGLGAAAADFLGLLQDVHDALLLARGWQGDQLSEHIAVSDRWIGAAFLAVHQSAHEEL